MASCNSPHEVKGVKNLKYRKSGGFGELSGITVGSDCTEV